MRTEYPITIKEVNIDEDNIIIIETIENGLDCFYAINTKDGDFKGIWINKSDLRRESLTI